MSSHPSRSIRRRADRSLPGRRAPAPDHGAGHAPREPDHPASQDGAAEEAQTKMHDRVFAFIVTYKRTHDGNAPSLRQIARALDVDLSTVTYHLGRLVDAGRIRRTGRRSIEVIGGAWQLAGDASDSAAPGTAPDQAPDGGEARDATAPDDDASGSAASGGTASGGPDRAP